MNCCLRINDECSGYRVSKCPNDKTCKFYKPEGCKDWVRIKDMIYPPEDTNKKHGVEL